MASAKGKLTQQGTPLPGATLYLFPTGNTKAPGSYAVTDEEGNFELRTGNDGVGVPPGQYTVTISKLVQADGSPIPPDAETIAELDLKEVVPPVYQDSQNSPVTFVIPEGGIDALQVDLP